VIDLMDGANVWQLSTDEQKDFAQALGLDIESRVAGDHANMRKQSVR